MERSLEQVKLSNKIAFGSKIPEFDDDVLLFILSNNQIIALTRTRNTFYYGHEYVYTIVTHDNRSGDFLFDAGGNLTRLSIRDIKTCLIRRMEHLERVQATHIVKIKNNDPENSIMLENNYSVDITYCDNKYIVKIYNSQENMIGELDIPSKYIKNNIWFAIHLKSSIGTKNAMKI